MLCDKVSRADLTQFLSLVGDKYIAEEKFDGDRIRLSFKGGKVTLTNRRGIEVTERYPELHNFDCYADIFLDGEMCVLDSDGVSQFNEGIAFRSHCKSASSIAAAASQYPVTFVVFDILEFKGENLRSKTYEERRNLLERVGFSHPSVIICEQFTDIQTAWNRMCTEGREGLILKAKSSLYREGYRSVNWKKVKNVLDVDLRFTKYDVNPRGITVENSDGIRVAVGGQNQWKVRDKIDKAGTVTITVRHLGETKSGKLRQPVFAKLVVP